MLAGQSYVERGLVLDQAKGGIVTAALVLNVVNPIMARGADLAGFKQEVPDGVMVELNAESDSPRSSILPA